MENQTNIQNLSDDLDNMYLYFYILIIFIIILLAGISYGFYYSITQLSEAQTKLTEDETTLAENQTKITNLEINQNISLKSKDWGAKESTFFTPFAFYERSNDGKDVQEVNFVVNMKAICDDSLKNAEGDCGGWYVLKTIHNSYGPIVQYFYGVKNVYVRKSDNNYGASITTNTKWTLWKVAHSY